MRKIIVALCLISFTTLFGWNDTGIAAISKNIAQPSKTSKNPKAVPKKETSPQKTIFKAVTAQKPAKSAKKQAAEKYASKPATKNISAPKSKRTTTQLSKKAIQTPRSISLARQKAASHPVLSLKEPALHSDSVLVYDEAFDNVVFEKNANQVKPIASLTKLMSAMVFLDAGLPMDKEIAITEEDVDTMRNSSSRLAVGSVLKRDELLRLSLMSSENRATSALSRTSYPGGKAAFVAKMNQKARSIGMYNTRYEDPTGLDENNVSTASDLLKLVRAAYNYSTIRDYSTTACYHVWPEGLGKQLEYKNSNCLVRDGDWDIALSKTGFIREAGKCLVMRTQIAHRPFVFVLLDSDSTSERTQDAEHLRKWIEFQGVRYTSSASLKSKS